MGGGWGCLDELKDVQQKMKIKFRIVLRAPMIRPVEPQTGFSFLRYGTTLKITAPFFNRAACSVKTAWAAPAPKRRRAPNKYKDPLCLQQPGRFSCGGTAYSYHIATSYKVRGRLSTAFQGCPDCCHLTSRGS